VKFDGQGNGQSETKKCPEACASCEISLNQMTRLATREDRIEPEREILFKCELKTGTVFCLTAAFMV
jgi:hypothetical protein